MKEGGILVRNPKVVWQEDESGRYAKIEEFVPENWGLGFSLARVTLNGPDVLHHHNKGYEIYTCLEGRGYLWVDGLPLLSFQPGNGEVEPTTVVIKPGLLHAAVPEHPSENLMFWCFSCPGFKPEDFIEHEMRREWYKKLEGKL